MTLRGAWTFSTGEGALKIIGPRPLRGRAPGALVPTKSYLDEHIERFITKLTTHSIKSTSAHLTHVNSYKMCQISTSVPRRLVGTAARASRVWLPSTARALPATRASAVKQVGRVEITSINHCNALYLINNKIYIFSK